MSSRFREPRPSSQWRRLRTFAEAREARRARGSQVASGEFFPAAHGPARLSGGNPGPSTALSLNGSRCGTSRRASRLSEIAPRDGRRLPLAGWRSSRPRAGAGLGSLMRRFVRHSSRCRSCLATARREGLIRHNPAFGAMLPHRPRVEEDEERVRPFPTGTMELVVGRRTPPPPPHVRARPGCGDQSYWRSKAAIFTLAAEAHL